MNGAEQRRHTTKTNQLAEDLETLEALLHETARRVHDAERNLAAVIDQAGWAVAQGKDHGRALDLTVARLERVKQELDTAVQATANFVCRGFWGRWRWLLTGR
jgi:hypothetical protein